MRKLFIQILSPENPKEDSCYFIKIKNDNNLIFCHYNKETNEWREGDVSYLNSYIEYWLKEVVLPTDEEIDASHQDGFVTNDCNNIQHAKRTGAKWLKDKIIE